MLSDIVSALEFLNEIYSIYEQFQENEVLFRRLCERVQLFTNFLQELQINCSNPKFSATASLRDSVIQLTNLLGEIKDFLTNNSKSSDSFFGSVKRIVISISFRNHFTNDLNSLNQRINDCVSNLLPSLGINFEEQRRLDTEALKNQIDFVTDDVVHQLIQLNLQGNSSKMMELLTDIKSNSDDMKTEIVAQILELETKISSSKRLTSKDFVELRDLFHKEKETLKAFLDDKLAEYNHQIQIGLHKMEENIGEKIDKIDGVLFKILNEIYLSRDEKQKRQELLKRVIIPSSSRVEVKETSVLGMGGFGTVYLGFYDAAKVAIKSLSSANGKEVEAVENEVMLMNYLGSHPNILTCYGIWKDSRGLTLIVLDYSPYGSLIDLLNDFKNFPEISIRLQIGWVLDLINAVYFIHQKNVKHRDIKADNLLVFSELRVKLCDFGLSKQHSQSRKSSILGGTQGFIAPEVVAGEGSGFPSDIFSWAMTFYQIVMREYPQVTLSHSQVMGNLLVELEDKLDGTDLGPTSSLLTDCIHKNPEERLLAGDINQFMLGFLRNIGGDPRLGIHTGDDEMINNLEGRLKKIKKVTFVSQELDGHKVAAELTKAQEATDLFAMKLTGVCEMTLEGHSKCIYCLLQLADGRVVSYSEDNTLKVWNVHTGVCEMTLEAKSPTTYIVRHILVQLADGRVVSNDRNKLKVWNVNTGVCEMTLEKCGFMSIVQQLTDGRVVSDGDNNTLKVWNVNTGVCEKTLYGHVRNVHCLVKLADGRVVSGGGYDDNTIKVWNIHTGVCEKTLKGHSNLVGHLVQLADGGVVSGSGDGTLKVWNVNTGVCEQTLFGHSLGGIRCLVLLADGRVVSCSGDEKLFMVWNVAEGVFEKALVGHRGNVSCLAQLADGRVVSGSEDHTLKVWDVNTGVCEQTLVGHRYGIRCLVLLADGRVVSGESGHNYTITDDNTLRVWK